MAAYIPLLYFLMVLVWIILAVSYYVFKDWALTMLAALFIIILGFQIINVGLDGAQDIISTSIGLVYFGSGAYILLRTGIDTITKYWG